ncbi:2-oxo acid dehydrogenase subunit E2 [Soehngenia longivitae]|uniref:Dihydrolipoamide acetyltransferase component of pyruvate dehydrogenase complex n=2 Tax=Soehngenia longivitae TaxID=2562294 RepID=A0A4Z0D4P5_9FIRM|nr:2-oxo acid dehydrogenase subunit E2 [Soehngenia longivitae]
MKMKFEFQFPDIGEGIHEGVITKWLVKEGDMIKEGDSVAEVETDKVTTEIPSPKTGKIIELKASNGDTIHVGDVFVVIDTEGSAEEVSSEDKKDTLAEKKEIVEEENAGVVGEVISSSEVIAPSDEKEGNSASENVAGKALATPVARKLAKDLGVDINKVVGSGPNGRVMKEDIIKASKQPSEAEHKEVLDETVKTTVDAKEEKIIVEEEKIERIPLTRIRKTISQKMTQSRFTIPHTTAMDEIDVTQLYEFRKKYKDSLKEEEINLTFMPFIIKATISVLKKMPEFNATLDEENDELILKKFYHIGIATDTDRGLMVPVIRDADRLSIIELAKKVDEVSNSAKNNQIELKDLKGSSFTITNYGSIGGYYGIPIINYPESAILGVGRIVQKPVVKDDEIVKAWILPLSLSYDHRIIDGASGARFLNMMRELLENPEMLLLKA